MSNGRSIIIEALERAHDRIVNTPGNEFSGIGSTIKTFLRSGLRPPRRRPKTGKILVDICGYFWYRLRRLLYDIDTKWEFNGRKVMTKSGIRVRTTSEKKLAEFLDSRYIIYRYEDPLVIDGFKAKPDFYLPKEGVYIEYWGLPHRRDYKKYMKWKKHQYRKHCIKVVSIYPEDLRNPEKNIPRCYKKDIGREMPNYSSRRKKK